MSVLNEKLTLKDIPSVLMILDDLSALGGAEQQAWRLAQALHNRGVKVELVTGCWNRQKPGRKTMNGIPVHHIPTAGRLVLWRGGRRISRYVTLIALSIFLWRHRNEYKILHFHESDFLAVAGILIGHLFDKRVITKIRASGRWSDLQNVMRHWRGIEKPTIIAMLRRADRTISLNEDTTQELLAAGFQPNRITQMVNGIEAEKYTVRSDYALGDPPRLVFAGRLEPQKDVKTLLQAIALVKPLDIHACILGGGPQRQLLKGMASELGIRERVAFCGRVSDVTPYLQEADLFVLPSLSEGISNALLEAMSCGLPCLATDIPGNRAVITDREDGHLFAPGDPEALAHLFTILLSDESLRRRTGQAARETVIRRFAMSAVVEAYLALYCQLANGSETKIYLEHTKRGGYVRY